LISDFPRFDSPKSLLIIEILNMISQVLIHDALPMVQNPHYTEVLQVATLA
jgi:hypothetical protein